MYKRIITKKGREMIYKDGKLVSTKEVPEQELAKLRVVEYTSTTSNGEPIVVDGVEMVEEVQTVDGVVPNQPTLRQEEAPVVEKICIFCGQNGDASKFVNLQTAYLCEEDYLSKTTGEVVEQLRKLQPTN